MVIYMLLICSFSATSSGSSSIMSVSVNFLAAVRSESVIPVSISLECSLVSGTVKRLTFSGSFLDCLLSIIVEY